MSMRCSGAAVATHLAAPAQLQQGHARVTCQQEVRLASGTQARRHQHVDVAAHNLHFSSGEKEGTILSSLAAL